MQKIKLLYLLAVSGPHIRGIEFIILNDFYKLSIEVTFSQISTNLLAMVCEDIKFQNIELHRMLLVRSRLIQLIWVLSAIMNFLFKLRFISLKIAKPT